MPRADLIFSVVVRSSTSLPGPSAAVAAPPASTRLAAAATPAASSISRRFSGSSRFGSLTARSLLVCPGGHQNTHRSDPQPPCSKPRGLVHDVPQRLAAHEATDVVQKQRQVSFGDARRVAGDVWRQEDVLH